jgi:GSH-dependent disulfide-bond oxidoreductase
MIDLYAWGTTNGRRALIIAEETGLPFTLRPIDIRKGEQKTPEYERINPYRKIPALVDTDGPGGKPATVFESVAICFCLAEKTGRFLGSPADHPNVRKWSMFHATNVLPALVHTSARHAALSISRYLNHDRETTACVRILCACRRG